MSIAATYVDADTFTVVGDQTVEFHAGRRVKMEGGEVRYGTIATAVFTTLTTINLTAASDDVHASITGVLYGIISGKEDDCSMPIHTHDGDEGSGGSIAYEPADAAIVKSDEDEVITADWQFNEIGLGTAAVNGFLVYGYSANDATASTATIQSIFTEAVQPATDSEVVSITLEALSYYTGAGDLINSGHNIALFGKAQQSGTETATVALCIGAEGYIDQTNPNGTITHGIAVAANMANTGAGTITDFTGFYIPNTTADPSGNKYSLRSDDVDAVLLHEGTVQLKKTIYILERAEALGEIEGYGQIWVNTATPNELWFTDDAGTDVQLGLVGIDNVVEDTTPDLGGDLDWNSNGMKLTSQTVAGSNGDLVYLSSANTWTQADADAESSCSGMLGIRISATEVLTQGVYTTSGLTAASTYYASTTAGGLTVTAPTGDADIVRVIGYALSTTEFFFDPDKTFIEIAA